MSKVIFPESDYIIPTNTILAESGKRVFFTFPLIWAVISYFAGYYSNQFQLLSLLILLIMSTFSIVRLWHCRRVNIDPPLSWRKSYIILTLANTAIWSAVGVFVLSVEGSNTITFAWVMAIAGIISSGMSYMGIISWFSISFQTILVIPTCTVLAFSEQSKNFILISTLTIIYLIQMSFISVQRAKQHKASLTNSFMLKKYAKNLKHASEIDTLTNINNRGRFESLFRQQWQNKQRFKQPIAILMFDLDDFKSINDTYGHQVGDRVLQVFAQILQCSVSRATDVVARYGGEEFIILLPDTNIEGAVIVAERIRMATELAHTIVKGQQVDITVSIGIASAAPHENSLNQRQFLKNADDALYQAKHQGKNKVITAAA